MKRLFQIFLVCTMTIANVYPVFACPVCFSAEGGTLNAFRLSTIFLTLTPLVIFFLFIQWFRKKAKDLDFE